MFDDWISHRDPVELTYYVFVIDTCFTASRRHRVPYRCPERVLSDLVHLPFTWCVQFPPCSLLEFPRHSTAHMSTSFVAYWQVAMTIYGRGSYNRLYIYLPVLATWLVVGEVVYCLGAVVLARKSRKLVAQEGH
jgi:hypothetical protein